MPFSTSFEAWEEFEMYQHHSLCVGSSPLAFLFPQLVSEEPGEREFTITACAHVPQIQQGKSDFQVCSQKGRWQSLPESFSGKVTGVSHCIFCSFLRAKPSHFLTDMLQGLNTSSSSATLDICKLCSGPVTSKSPRLVFVWYHTVNGSITFPFSKRMTSSVAWVPEYINTA